MHQCEFCTARYQARSQVKRPRACADCQKNRQRANEKAWHIKNKAQFNPRYFQIQKILRFKQLKKISQEYLKYFRVGFTLHGKQLNLLLFEQFLLKFLLQLGVRRVNKLWAAP